MLLAAVTDFSYKLLMLLHIFTVIVAFAPGFVNPVLNVAYRRDGQGIPADLAAKLVRAGHTIHGPALVLAGVFGFGLIGTSEKVWAFDQAWISAAMLLWFIMMGVLWGLLLPAEKKVAKGDADAAKIASMAGGILHLLLAVMLIIMIWKPGGPSI